MPYQSGFVDYRHVVGPGVFQLFDVDHYVSGVGTILFNLPPNPRNGMALSLANTNPPSANTVTVTPALGDVLSTPANPTFQRAVTLVFNKPLRTWFLFSS